jgi:hypothetical protein
MLRFTGIFGEFVIFPTSVSPTASHLLPKEKALTECKPPTDKRSFKPSQKQKPLPSQRFLQSIRGKEK